MKVDIDAINEKVKSEGPWSKIRRFDGKIGWIKKDSYEVI